MLAGVPDPGDTEAERRWKQEMARRRGFQRPIAPPLDDGRATDADGSPIPRPDPSPEPDYRAKASAAAEKAIAEQERLRREEKGRRRGPR